MYNYISVSIMVLKQDEIAATKMGNNNLYFKKETFLCN